MTSNEYRNYVESCTDVGLLKKEIKSLVLVLSNEDLKLHQVIDFSNKLIIVANRLGKLQK